MFQMNDAFLVVFFLLTAALGVSNFVETRNQQDQILGRPFFALLFLVVAVGLASYKIMSP
jgi:uncharacterized membrane protein YidH (DUF202 family)